jgi:hypothetical protein
MRPCCLSAMKCLRTRVPGSCIGLTTQTDAIHSSKSYRVLETGTPLHVHEREDEHFFLVERAARFADGARKFRITVLGPTPF